MRSCCWKSLLLVFYFPLSLVAQDFSWWNETHQWDGHTHWSSYVKLSPAFMGPNAFPIPFAEKITRKKEFDIRFNTHQNSGEKSWDFYARFALPLGEKAALKIEMNPIEYFQMDTSIRNRRVARDEFPEGYATGDILVEMSALVFEDDQYQLLFNVGLKTASGSQFRNARYTDSPAYYLDLSYHIQRQYTENLSFDAGFLLGLYVWQTYMINNRQNDAILVAASFKLHYKDFSLIQNLRGFKGYLNNGDQPLLYSLKIAKNWKTHQLYVAQQITLHDYPYNTTQFGVKRNF